MRLAIITGAVVLGGVYLALQSQDAGQGGATDEDDTEQLTSVFEDMKINITPSTWAPAAVDDLTASVNQRAFLETIKYAEGVRPGIDGYRTLFGGALFDGFADHPRIAKQFTDRAGRKLWTSAAGAYQFMAVSPLPGGGSTRVNTWDVLQRRLGLPDFGPASQDRAALELVRERGALADVQAGRIVQAIQKCAPVWASLPGAGYAQQERKINTLLTAYANSGGNLEA